MPKYSLTNLISSGLAVIQKEKNIYQRKKREG